jgi:hypothetical protein
MAFIKLFPSEGGEPLPGADIIRRLRDEFALVVADPDEGRDHVAGMIAATLQFSDAVPGKPARLAWLESVQEDAVWVKFGDSQVVMAACCLMPNCELFFGSPDEVEDPARSLVERCAAALGYELFQG